MKIVQVLLARTNFCKRIPKKPLVNLGGLHLIEWTLMVMEYLPYEGYVYTDNDEVKSLVKKYGLNARPKIYENEAGKHYTREELKEYNKEMQADIIVMYQLTSPFRDIEATGKWIEEFPGYNVDCALSVYQLSPDILYSEDGERVWPQIRTYQNNKVLFKETGSIYIFKKEQIEKSHLTLGKRKLLLDPWYFDIDTYEDLQQAEEYVKANRLNEGKIDENKIST